MAEQRLAAAEREIFELKVKVDALEQLQRQMRRKYTQLLELVEQRLPGPDAAQQAASEGAEGGDEGEEENEEDNNGDDYEGDAGEKEAVEKADPHPFKCSEPGCNFEYTHRANLDQHMANTHTSDPATRKAHVCPVCSASYDKASSVKTHLKLHDPAAQAERQPVPGGCVCPVAGCGKVCKSLMNRKDHLARNHKGWRKAHPGWKNE